MRLLPKDSIRPDAGFALVLALSLMAFVLVLLVSLTLLVSVETKNSSRINSQLLARENARLGLMVALGKLESELRADKRITARADILDSPTVQAHSEHWIGIWNTEDLTSAPVWLVSGEQPLPTSVLNEDNSLLLDRYTPDANVSFSSAAREVRAPKVIIDSAGESGEFAYWISDEGLKASVALPDRWYDLDIGDYENAGLNFDVRSTWLRDRSRKMSGGIFNIESDLRTTLGSNWKGTFPTHFVADPDDTADEGIVTFSYFDRTVELRDLSLGKIELPQAYLDYRSPDYTIQNYFTLTNTLDGGYRQDLSHLRRIYDSTSGSEPAQSDLDAAFDAPQWDYITPEVFRFVNFDRYHNFDPLVAPEPVGSNIPENFEDLNISFPTTPIVTEFAWNAGLGVRSTSSGPTKDVYLYFYCIGELLNPFGFPLALDNGSGAWPGDPSDILIRISNLPDITIKNLDQGSVPVTFDLSELVIATGINSYNDHDSGYMRPNFAPTSSYRSAISGSTGVGVFAVKLGELNVEPDSVRDDFEVEFDTSEVLIEFRESNTNALQNQADREQWAFYLTDELKPVDVPTYSPEDDPTRQTRLIQRITLLNWGGFNIFYEGGTPGGSNDTRFVRGGSAMKRSGSDGSLNDGLVNFGIRGKFVDEWVEVLAPSNEQSLSQTFKLTDLRRAEIQIDMDNLLAGDGEFYDIFLPREMDRSEFIRMDDFLQGAPSGSDLNNRIARLFDAPAQEPISIVPLNNMHFKGLPYRPMANLIDGREPPLLPPGTPVGSVDMNAPGKSLNNFFDRYFFSTIPSDSSIWNKLSPLPNQKIVYAKSSENVASAAIEGDLESAGSARHILIKGGFNINSTSEAAWEALLNPRQIASLSFTRSADSAERNRLVYADNVERIFYSRPFSGDKSIQSQSPEYDFVRSDSTTSLAEEILTDGSKETYIQGMRELSATETRDLAKEIVRRIKLFGNRESRGFSSLSEFLNEGILQQAIDAVSNINRPDGKPIPKMAPVYLTSDMILNAVSHYLFTRSDTFKIRVSANANDRTTGKALSTVLLEATVQRFPDSDSDGISPLRILNIKEIEI